MSEAHARALASVENAVAVVREETERRTREWVERAAPANTTVAYKSALTGWKKYCETKPCKASDYDPVWIAAYLRQMSEEGKAESTIGLFLSAVKKDREWEDGPDPTQHKLVVKAASAASKLAPPPNPKLPLTWEMIRLFAAKEASKEGSEAKVVGVRDVCLVLMSFTGMLRSSEVAALDTNDVWIATRDSLTSGEVRELKVFIKKHKGDQKSMGEMRTLTTRFGMNESVTQALHAGCPALWLSWYNACRGANKRVPPPVDWSGVVAVASERASQIEEILLARQEAKLRRDANGAASGVPLFVTEAGKRMSSSTPNGRVQAMIVGLGLGLCGKLYGSHSNRSGGATAANTAGSDPLAIKSHGGWKSNTYERYVRQDAQTKGAVTSYVRS